jgi:hypothetical protein
MEVAALQCRLGLWLAGMCQYLYTVKLALAGCDHSPTKTQIHREDRYKFFDKRTAK